MESAPMNALPFPAPSHRSFAGACRRAFWFTPALLAVAGSWLAATAPTRAAEVAWTNITGKMGWGQTVGPGDGTPGAPNNWTSTPDFPGEFDDVLFDNRANDDGVWIGGPGYADLGYRLVNSMVFRESNPKRILGWSAESTLTSSRRLDIVAGLIVEADSGPVQMGDAINASTGILRLGVRPDTFIRNDSPLPITFGSLDNIGSQASIYGQGLTAGYADQPGASVKLIPLEGSGAGGMVFNVNIQDGSTNLSGTRPLGVQVNVPNATVSFNVPNEYTGPTVIDAGTLAIRTVDRQGESVFGSIDTSTRVTVNTAGTLDVTDVSGGLTVAPSQTIGGLGTVAGTLTVGASAALAPSPGTFSVTGDVAWGPYSGHVFKLADTSVDGWGLLDIGGSLTMSADPFSPVLLDLESLSATAPDTPGLAAGFNPALPYTWEFARAAGGIAGFNADAFQINPYPSSFSAGFLNDLQGGSFSVTQTGNSLNLVFTPAGGVPTDIVIDVASGSITQAQAGYAAIPAATSVTKTGAGTVVFDAANTYVGPTTISAGTLQVTNSDALAATAVTVDTGATLAVAGGTTMKSPSVIVDGGTLSAATLAVNTTTGIASLAINAGTISGSPAVTVDGGGQLALPSDARVAVSIGSLAVAQTAGGGRLDLGAGQVSIAAGGISAADLRADIIAGRNSGGWNGTAGITSSTAAAAGGARAVGYVVAGDGSAVVSFAAPGDIDLSGAVNVFDLVGINASGTYGTGQTADWNDGDMNYDGVTNVFDLVTVNGGGAYNQGNYFPAAPTVAGGVAAVPEPTALLGVAIAGLATGSMVRRRRPQA
jgi:autotransporter-associated beta strand protein